MDASLRIPLPSQKCSLVLTLPVVKTSMVLVGATAAGKSTLVNALLGVNLAPTGRGETTGRILRLTYDCNVRIELRNPDGCVSQTEPFPGYNHSSATDVARLATVIDHFVRRPDDNDPEATTFLYTQEVVVYVPVPILQLMDLYDLPGYDAEIQPHLAAVIRRVNPVIIHVWKKSEQITGQDLLSLEQYLRLYADNEDLQPLRLFLAANGTDMAEYISDDDQENLTPELVLASFKQEEARRYVEMRKHPRLPSDIFRGLADDITNCAFFAATSALDTAGKSASKARLCRLAFDDFCWKLLSFAFAVPQMEVQEPHKASPSSLTLESVPPGVQVAVH